MYSVPRLRRYGFRKLQHCAKLERHTAIEYLEHMYKELVTRRISVLDIQPYPNVARNGKTGGHKRKAKSSAVLTSSPYKARRVAERSKKTYKLSQKHASNRLRQQVGLARNLADLQRPTPTLHQLPQQLISCCAYTVTRHIHILLSKTG